jgi:hypothetical protein
LTGFISRSRKIYFIYPPFYEPIKADTLKPFFRLHIQNSTVYENSFSQGSEGAPAISARYIISKWEGKKMHSKGTSGLDNWKINFRPVSGLAEILIPEKTCYSYDRNRSVPVGPQEHKVF